MADYKNICGTAISLPVLIEGDILPNQVITVPDDVVMSPEYFEPQ